MIQYSPSGNFGLFAGKVKRLNSLLEGDFILQWNQKRAVFLRQQFDMDGGEEGGLNRQNKSNQKLNIYALPPPPPPNPPTLPTPSPYAISEFELVCALWFKYEISSNVRVPCWFFNRNLSNSSRRHEIGVAAALYSTPPAGWHINMTSGAIPLQLWLCPLPQLGIPPPDEMCHQFVCNRECDFDCSNYLQTKRHFKGY